MSNIERSSKVIKTLKEYTLITIFTLLFVMGTYFFKFPNNFTFGGVTGLAIVLAKVTPFSPSLINLVISMALLVIGFIFLGKGFGLKTVYVNTLMSIALWGMDYIHPITQPLTDNKLLELIFATLVPGLGSALLFNIGASSGGTDIVAMILKKNTSLDIGKALLISDALITLSSFFVFNMETFLLSVLGLLAKALVVDNIIESINRSKVFNVICKNPEPICEYIVKKLGRSATTVDGEGAYSGNHKYIIFTAMKSYQAVLLRQFIKEQEPNAFILISNTSEIIGRGFGRGLD
jgi:uncharacterized membrane-anchored protein YitT (DUF2179 family)